MNSVTTPANADILGSRKASRAAHLLNSDYIGWQRDFIMNSFYLPMDVLADRSFAIKPIRVITGQQYADVLSLAAGVASGVVTIVNEGANHRMLQKAKLVGVSERELVGTGKTVLLCKIWYGRTGDKETAL